jgi:hypothetical protein
MVLYEQASTGSSGDASGEMISGQGPMPLFKAPRSLMWDFVLHFGTAGFYTCFWMVGRLRELRRLDAAKVIPWLWFFVPITIFAQIFALPRLIRMVRTLEVRCSLPQWGALGNLWMLAVIIVSLFFLFLNRIGLPEWYRILGLMVWAGLSQSHGRYRGSGSLAAGNQRNKHIDLRKNIPVA